MNDVGASVTADLPVDLHNIEYVLEDGPAGRARIGLIVLGTDQTIERDISRVYACVPGVSVYVSRIENDPKVSPESLAAMEGDIGRCARIILPGLGLAAIGYCCTSASMVIGEERVLSAIGMERPEAASTTPITAAFAAMRTLGIERPALLTPYRDDINRHIRAYVAAKGVDIRAMGSFNEDDDNKVGRIDANSIRDAGIALARHDAVDGLFISCTALRAMDAIPDIEDAVGKPVISSNQAIAWHLLRLSGVQDALDGFGHLFLRELE